MGSLVALVRFQFARTDLARGFGFVDIDLIGQGLGIGFIGQRLPRHLDEVRVAQILRTVGVGIFLRLGHHLQGIRAAETKFMHIEVFEDVEDLHDVDPARGRRRHGVDLIPAIVAANRRALHGFVLREIGFGDQPAVLAHLFGNLVGNHPFIEGVRAIFGNHLQTFGEVGLHQLVALLQRLALLPEDRFTVLMVGDHFAAVGFQIVGQSVVDLKAVARQLDGRLHHFVQRQGAVLIQCQREARYRTRCAGRQMGGEGFFTVGVALVVEEHVARGLGGCHFTEVDCRGGAIFGTQHHKTAAAEVTRLRVRHRQRIADRHRRIHRITALLEDIHPDLGGEGINRRDHPLLRSHGMEHIFFHAVGDRGRGRRIRCHAKRTACRQGSNRYPA